MGSSDGVTTTLTHTFFVLLLYLNICAGIDRVFYIACNEEIWDYAPSGNDSLHPDGYGLETEAPMFLDQAYNRVGHKYKKAIYRQYTDATYSTEIPKPEWQGFLGPTLMAEMGDNIIIHFYNNASRTYSMHPHGVAYKKKHEGAQYVDGFHYTDKSQDIVPPKQSHTYNWTVSDFSGPGEGDPDCITWLYHSHVLAPEDVTAGLVGFLLTCRKYRMEEWKKTKLYLMYVSKVDENMSWYMEDNIRLFTNGTVDREDGDFQESNSMYQINGYVFGHLPGLKACPGETIHWHMASLGTEVDIHSMVISGHSFEYFDRRTDAIRLTVAHFVTASMTAQDVGKWLLQCQVNSHISEGMRATFEVELCNNVESNFFQPSAFRQYYIAAKEAYWNYAPSGMNKYDGGSLVQPGSDSEVFFMRDSTHIGGVYKKAQYVEYTDSSFTVEKQNSEREHLGFLGPVIRAEVGDQIQVTFNNMASRPYSIHAHGVRFNKRNEGSLYNDGNTDKGDDYVLPNTQQVYTWTIPEEMGPTADDAACLTRVYTSSVDTVKDTYSGLIGPMLICRKGTLDQNGKMKDVDKEFFLFFAVTDENKSWYLDENIAAFGVNTNINKKDEDFMESNLMHGINGRLYANLDGLVMCEGDLVVWHAFSIGNEVDLHTVIFNGDNLNIADNHRSSSDILPGNMRSLHMEASRPGSWGLFCATNDHYVAGTKAIYTVNTCSANAQQAGSGMSGNEIMFYLQAEEVEWDYVPKGQDIVSGQSFNAADNPGGVFVNRAANRIGGTYIKAIYKEYTDSSFRASAFRPAEEEYLGLLGPIIRVQVGDVLNIVFRNNATREYSVRAQGLFYYDSNTQFSATTQPGVNPGETFTYRWTVPESAGPGPNDPDCVASIYSSNVDFVKDVYSGLIGPLAICRKGALAKFKGKFLRDRRRDFAVHFSVIDENQSWYLQRNIQRFTANPNSVDVEDGDFAESNLMHAINGYLYANENHPVLYEGEDVDWYLLGTGTEVDMHNIHFHGNDLTVYEQKKHTNDVVQLFPSIFITATMHADNKGLWLYHCHVNDHIHAGMEGMYEVKDNPYIAVTYPFAGAGSLKPAITVLFVSLIFCLY